MHAFEYFGGVPRLLVPDNLRTGVSRACRYDPDLNPTYQEMAMHYGVGVVPARPYRPRDKAKVEVGVQVVERWIIAALRHRKFFRLEEVNCAVRELLERLNQRPFRKREGSRASMFAALERSALRPLPAERFDLSQWSRARVNIDYHIAFEGNFYSVPYTLVQEPVEVRSAPATVEIFHQGQRVASHLRSRTRGQAITENQHRPKSHQAHLEWTPSRMVKWAEQIGLHTARLFERILAEKPHPEMGYRSCLGIIRLAEQYSAARMEAAADRALRIGACRYQSVKSILKNSLDQQPLAELPTLPPPPPHDNIRGAGYFSEEV
jgi:transposase